MPSSRRYTRPRRRAVRRTEENSAVRQGPALTQRFSGTTTRLTLPVFLSVSLPNCEFHFAHTLGKTRHDRTLGREAEGVEATLSDKGTEFSVRGYVLTDLQRSEDRLLRSCCSRRRHLLCFWCSSCEDGHHVGTAAPGRRYASDACLQFSRNFLSLATALSRTSPLPTT